MSEPDWIIEAKAKLTKGQAMATRAVNEILGNQINAGMHRLNEAIGELVEASTLLLDRFVEEERAPELFPDGFDDGEEGPSDDEWVCETCGCHYPCECEMLEPKKK